MALGWLWWRAFPRRSRRCGVLRGRRGTWSTLCAAGVADDMDRHFAWQVAPLGWLWSLCGRHGTGLALVARLFCTGTPSLCMVGVALCDIDLNFVWQAWHLLTWIVTLRATRAMKITRRGT